MDGIGVQVGCRLVVKSCHALGSVLERALGNSRRKGRLRCADADVHVPPTARILRVMLSPCAMGCGNEAKHAGWCMRYDIEFTSTFLSSVFFFFLLFSILIDGENPDEKMKNCRAALDAELQATKQLLADDRSVR